MQSPSAHLPASATRPASWLAGRARWAAPYRNLGAAALIAAVVAFPLLAPNDYYLRLGSTVALIVVVLASLNLLYGYAGQVSVGHAAFFGIGTYGTSVLMVKTGLDFWLAWPAGIAISAIVGLLVGIPVLRLRGFFLLVATFGFGLATFTIFEQWGDVTGGAIGLAGITRPHVFGFSFVSEATYFYLCGVAMLLALALVWAVVRSRFGRILMAIREDEPASGVVGINTARAKLGAFVISTAIAGAAGGLFGPLILYVSPQSFTPEQSILLLTVLVIGGLGRHWGAIVGGLLFVALSEVLRETGAYKEVLYGAVLLLAVLFMPEGIAGMARQTWERLSRSLRRNGHRVGTGATQLDVAVPGFVAVGPHVNGRQARKQPVLEVDALGCRFGHFVALEDVDLTLSRGEFLGLIGPNGAGKSTLINVVSGTVPSSCGEVSFAGRRLNGLPPHARSRLGLARTFQTTRLFPRLSVLDNVRVAIQAADRGEHRKSLARARELLTFAGLEGLEAEPAASLSFGHRRLLELARALATRPRVLLLDEPAAGLNEYETDVLAQRLRALAASGIGIVLVEHDLRLVLGSCDRVSVLVSGRTLIHGSPQEIQDDERVVDAYLGRRRTHTHSDGTVRMDAVATHEKERR